MKNLLLTSFLILLAGEIASHPTSVISSGSLERNTDLPVASTDQDSHLERVHVKQETGFDGKVRSIRFSLEPGKDEKPIGVRVNHADNVVPEVVTSSSESDSKSSSGSFSALDTALSSRSRRSIDQQSDKNTLDDLQAEEARVFRPLFVYRQQVARRLKIRNDRQPISGGRPRVQRTKPNYNPYYYPSDYPYRYAPYEYPRY
ncbi:wolbachia density suppressor isoform X1 [Nasonia vitripennis]|uniref:Uncharacterized protein n=1 Tax=Nasonia vitripennis TaxID=7425 RepID=A0A7M6UHH7_NASVI|nr:Wolbachia density suppressor precursor [Nasonia vitripennis]XP_032453634.1 wolbachia density suppressor isoform X1 [Nasonia vitripennis]